MISKGAIQNGDIWWADFGEGKGVEIKGHRPALVIQSNKQLRISNLVTIMALTSNLGNKIPGDVTIKKDSRNGLLMDSIVKVRHITSYDYSRFIRKIGVADNSVIETVKGYLRDHFGL